MKKLITLLLVLTGMVSTVSADEVTIYFQPNSDWAKENATFKLYGYVNYDDANAGSVKDMSKVIDYGNGIYSATMDLVSYPYVRFGRYQSDEVTWCNTTNTTFVPTAATYYYMTGSQYGDWNYYPCTASSYLPEKFYFMSNLSGSWAAGNALTEKDGEYTYSFNASDYAGKCFAWAPGYAFKDDGSVNDWSLVYRPKNNSNENPKTNDWVMFSTLSYNNTLVLNAGEAVWYIPTSDQAAEQTSSVLDAKVNISFTTPGNTATISCSKEVTIDSPGYATYSNGEKYTVSGAQKVYVATGKGENTITLTIMDESTVFDTNAGIIMKGSSATIKSVVSNASAYSGTNYLFGSGNNSKSVDNITNVYVFSWDGENASSVGFYAAKSTGSIAAHKAYLDLAGATSRFLSFTFADESTGISEAATQQNDNAIYNLQGVRMNQFQKGLNIVNGKKILVK